MKGYGHCITESMRNTSVVDTLDTHRLMFVGNQKRQHHSCLNSYPSNSVEDACLSWIDDILYKLNVSSTAFTCLLSISLRTRILLFVLNAYNVKNMPFLFLVQKFVEDIFSRSLSTSTNNCKYIYCNFCCKIN